MWPNGILLRNAGLIVISFASASTVRYSIVAGNTFNAFLIEDLTGKIRVNSPLDYENITSVSNSAKHDNCSLIHQAFNSK